MPFGQLVKYAQDRLAAYRRYHQAIAEIDAMTNRDLLEIGAFQTDLYRAARETYLGQ